jgi:hypothetical protein
LVGAWRQQPFNDAARQRVGILQRMCAQCMVTATMAAAGATGLRAWLAARGFPWMTARRLRWSSGALVAIAFVIAAGSLG